MEQESFESPHKLDKGQRIGVALLICITVLLVGVSIFQFKSNIFAYGRRVKSGDLASVDPATRAKNEEAVLKAADTDTDGLSDYDELAIYHSSPYMKDTDSDGAADGEEVRRGTSPTCPEGKDCLFNSLVAGTQASSTVPTALTSTDIVKPSVQSAPGTFTLSQIREALIENGVPKDQVDAMKDEELMKLVKEAQEENNAAPASGG